MNKFTLSLYFALFVLIVASIISLNMETVSIQEAEKRRYTDFVFNSYFDSATKELNKIYQRSAELQLECNGYSALTPRSDALACKNENAIFDPCYVDDVQNPKKVACVDTPWDRTVKMGFLKSKPSVDFKKKVDYEHATPFAIEVDEDIKCLLKTKLPRPIKLFAGLSSSAICFDKHLSFVQQVVFGDLRRGDEELKILFESESSTIHLKKVRAVIF